MSSVCVFAFAVTTVWCIHWVFLYFVHLLFFLNCSLLCFCCTYTLQGAFSWWLCCFTKSVVSWFKILIIVWKSWTTTTTTTKLLDSSLRGLCLYHAHFVLTWLVRLCCCCCFSFWCDEVMQISHCQCNSCLYLNELCCNWRVCLNWLYQSLATGND